MGPLASTKKRKLETAAVGEVKGKSRKKPREQPSTRPYTSPSPSISPADDDNDEFPAIDLTSSPSATASPPLSQRARVTTSPTPSSAASDHTSGSRSSLSSSSSKSSIIGKKRSTTRRKRNDPAAFSLSISKILGSKLSTSKRDDPVLARSAIAAQAHAELADAKLEQKARQKLREEKKSALDKGHVRDVLLGSELLAGGDADQDGKVAEMAREQERRLRKTAQRGVVKLFNAVRAAQVKGEEAARQGGAAGRKKERVAEMSKMGFLELVAGGGGGGKRMEKVIEEA